MATQKDEPRNAASDLGRRFLALFDQPSLVNEAPEYLSDDFVSEDKRRFVGLPPLDKAGFVEMVLSTGAEFDQIAAVMEVLSIRGDRAALTRNIQHYRDGSAREYLTVGQTDESGTRFRRFVRFDVDDLDAAMAELDRLAAALDG